VFSLPDMAGSRKGNAKMSSRTRVYLMTCLVLLAALLVGCVVATPTAEVVSGPAPVVVTDSRGRQVEVPAEVERIVSLAPSNTEILYALGLGPKVVGVTTFCDYPPEARSVEKVGDLMSMNAEQITLLSPDLVLAIDGLDEVVAKLEEVGIPVVIVQATDLESIYGTVELVGKAASAEQAAADLVASMRDRITEVAQEVAGVQERTTVFYELDATDPAKPYTPGPGTWHDEFITLAGGANIAADADMAWVQFSAEEIISRDPDVIILGDAKYGVSPEDVAQRPGWAALTAVQNGAIYPIDDDLISRPGPRVVEGIETLARILHPELFP